MNMKTTLTICFLLLSVACQTLNEGSNPSGFAEDKIWRIPATAGAWNLASLNFENSEVVGKCDLSPTNYIRRSNIKSLAVLLASAQLENCNLKIVGQKISDDGILIEGLYRSDTEGQLKLEISTGEIVYVNDEKSDSTYNTQGYVDVHFTGKGAYKLKSSHKLSLTGKCAPPVETGFWGFKKLRTTCQLNGAAGQVNLVYE